MSSASAPPVHLPPGPRVPGSLQSLAFLTVQRSTMHLLRRRYGRCFTTHLPLFGPTVAISDPALVKELFATPSSIAGNMTPNLGRIGGEGSIFNLDHDPHRRRRKVLVPPFNGRRMKAYEDLVAEEMRAEMSTWPVETEFATLEPFMRVTLNVILRAVFGAQGRQLQTLREVMPPMVELGSRLMLLPIPQAGGGPLNPWHRFRRLRRRYDEQVHALIEHARADADLEDRQDVLAMLVRSRYEDGEPMSAEHIADELLTLLGAGHETTATTLAWAVERLRRHPVILHRLVGEIDHGEGEDLLDATVLEVQRDRPVLAFTFRKVLGEHLELGDWVVPQGWTVLVGIDLLHHDAALYPNPQWFDPDRFLRAPVDWSQWIPFGGGTRRCIGAAFAEMEMKVVLRTMLREVELLPSTEPDEAWHFRGISFAPGRGGRAVVRRRADVAHGSAERSRGVPA